ncbi:MAG: hypothetical protein GY791_01435 [Alphaproteobacteria bacterium]|nr:hypothetical protein [Alphaproteobacteria bacterium]
MDHRGEDDLVAQDWLGGSSRHVAKWLVLEGEDGDVWSEFIDVEPGYRGRGLGPRLRSYVVLECTNAGIKRMLGLIDATNRNSFRAMGKLGYIPLGRLFFVRILGLALIRHGKIWRLGCWRPGAPLRVSVPTIAE